jgi:hypothetical protein
MRRRYPRKGGEMTPSEQIATVLLVVCLIAFHILLVVG